MAQYFFSAFTEAQAQTFNALSDSIFFNTPEVGSDFRVTINTLLGEYELTTLAGKSFDFGPGLLGATFTLSDGSVVRIGTNQGDNLVGTSGDDGLFGGDGSDTLVGGGGKDVIDGGAGADFLYSDSRSLGDDLFVFQRGQSLVDAPDTIVDWISGDKMEFPGVEAKHGALVSSSANSVADALAFANGKIASGAADYVAVTVGGATYVFVDDHDDNGVADAAVKVNQPNDVLVADIVGATAPSAPSGGGGGGGGGGGTINEPTLPDFGIGGLGASYGTVSGNVDAVHIGHLIGAAISSASSLDLSLDAPGLHVELGGSGFTYDSNEQLTGGTAFSFTYDDASAAFHASLTISPSVPVASFGAWVAADATQLLFGAVLQGNDELGGSAGADLLRGYGGSDYINGGGGSDTIYGGDGGDIILAAGVGAAANAAPVGSTYLRGEAGDDYILGGLGFDDINGNQGDDTLSGGAGNDWVVGGKDNDLQFGDDGNDIVWGNLGNDTLEGGAGDDQIRGGQGDDILFGDAGNDYISGDRGNDTETGGAGADIFHSFSGAGIDRVLDFHLSEGDRVMLDPGTSFNISQVGADTVIDMGNGDQLILVGVQASSLPPGTIFLG